MKLSESTLTTSSAYRAWSESEIRMILLLRNRRKYDLAIALYQLGVMIE